jgi:hypothetical protein
MNSLKDIFADAIWLADQRRLNSYETATLVFKALEQNGFVIRGNQQTVMPEPKQIKIKTWNLYVNQIEDTINQFLLAHKLTPDAIVSISDSGVDSPLRTVRLYYKE